MSGGEREERRGEGGIRVEGLGFRVEGGFRVCRGLGLRVEGFRFRVEA